MKQKNIYCPSSYLWVGVGVLNKKMVFDASSIIDLNINNVDFIIPTLNILKNDNLYISNINFNELYKNPDLQETIKNHMNIEIYNTTPDEFSDFRKWLRTSPHRIQGGDKDLYVLFVIKKLAEEDTNNNIDIYDITSDDGLYGKIKQMSQKIGLRNIRPFTTVALLNYMYQKQLIDFPTFTEKTLQIFKRKEIAKFVGNFYKQHNFGSISNQEIIERCKEQENAMRERFQLYKDPVIINSREIIRMNKAWIS